MADARLAAQELARREMARRDLAAFAWYTFPQYQIAPLHQSLADALMQVERYIATAGQEGAGRLMVFMPPRHGKSEMVSVRFPAWFLGRNPDKNVILVSCTANLAVSFSRRARNIVLDKPFQAVFGGRAATDAPVQIADDTRAADAWGLSGFAGGLVAAGVGGAIIGRGAHLAIIDDPFRDRADANSAAVRDRVDEWYRSVLYSRLERGGAIVLMHQRWHEDDLAGRLLKRMASGDGDRWEIVNLPALAEPWAAGCDPLDTADALQQGWHKSADPLGRAPDDALWPAKYPEDVLAQIRQVIGGYEWDAMYQQRPRQLEGALIKAHRIPVIEQPPDNLQLARYWDLAVSGRQRADYIAGALVGRARDGRLYILDVKRFPGPWADARPAMLRVMAELDDPAVVQGIETAGQQSGYFQELQRDPRLTGRAVRGVNPAVVGNKEVRAQVWASRIEDDLIYLRAGGWNRDFIDECLAFPRGQHDDQVDAVSGAVQMLASRAQVALGSAWAEIPRRTSE
jgi:predicted phage terminase large subunit-like protein